MPHKDLEKRRSCAKVSSRRHYEDNRERLIAEARIRSDNARVRNYRIVLDYLLDHPCLDCGEADPIVLDFDHRDDAVKEFNIAEAPRRGVSASRLLKEIAKCDIRCANCHRRRTYHACGGKNRTP